MVFEVSSTKTVPMHVLCVWQSIALLFISSQNEPEISALVHFVNRERGEYVIGGNDSGMLFWYVQLPRQKGFNLLLTERRHYSRITGLEVSSAAAVYRILDSVQCLHLLLSGYMYVQNRPV